MQDRAHHGDATLQVLPSTGGTEVHMSRFLGSLLAVAGLIAALALPLHPDELRPGALTDPAWVPVHLALLVSFTLSVPGVAGLWYAQREALPRWGHAAFLVALVGTALSVAMVALEVFALPHVARTDPRPLMDLLGPTGPLPMAGMLFGAGFCAWIPGQVAAAVATARSRVLPPGVGWALAVAAPSVAVPIHALGGVGAPLHALTGVAFGAAWLAAGLSVAMGGRSVAPAMLTAR